MLSVDKYLDDSFPYVIGEALAVFYTLYRATTLVMTETVPSGMGTVVTVALLQM